MSKEPDELDHMLTDLFLQWKEDIESVPQPILVTEEEAMEIIAAAVLKLNRGKFGRELRVRKFVSKFRKKL